MSTTPSDPPAPNHPEDSGCSPTLDPQTLDQTQECVAGEPHGPDQMPARRDQSRITPDGRLRTGRLAGLSMNKAIFVLAWPILIESYLNSMVGLTDTTLASQMSEAATDAIGVASYFAWFISLIAMALATGATALVSRSVGKGRLGVANAAVGQTIVLASISGIVVGVLLGVFAPNIARLVNLGEGDATEAFVGYMRVIAFSVPLSSVLFAGIACLRGAGDSIRPLWAMVAANVVNMIVSFTAAGVDLSRSRLVDGELVTTTLLRAPLETGLGITGIAIGTVAAHTVGAAIIIALLIGGKGGVRLKRRWRGPHPITMIRLARLGMPNFFESLGLWVGNFVVVMIVGWLALSSNGGSGEGYFGAHIWAIRIEAFSFLPGFAMGMAAATLAGQYLGAGSPGLARAAILRCTLVGASVMACMGAAFILVPEAIIGTFTAQASHLGLVPPLLVICGWVQIPFGVALVVRSALRGAGDVNVVLWLTWTTTYAVRIPLAWLFSGVDVPLPGGGVFEHPFIDEPSLSGLWLGLCIELAIRGCFFGARFLQGGWVNAKV